MFDLLWERQRRLLLVRFSDVLTTQDISDMDRAVVEFVGRHGRSDSIYDFSNVTAVAIPESSFVSRRYDAPLTPGTVRILVSPQEELHQQCLEFARQQAQLGYKRPHVTRTLDEAFQILQVTRPMFEAVPPGSEPSR